MVGASDKLKVIFNQVSTCTLTICARLFLFIVCSANIGDGIIFAFDWPRFDLQNEVFRFDLAQTVTKISF
jgi:hypothetical protein